MRIDDEVYFEQPVHATGDLFILTYNERLWIESLGKTKTWEACDGNTSMWESEGGSCVYERDVRTLSLAYDPFAQRHAHGWT